MIRIGLRYDSHGRIRYFSCTGHAGFDPQGGVDIVCAGVSAITCALMIGLQEVVALKVRVQASSGSVKLNLPARIPPDKAHDAQILMETAVKSLEAMSENYPGFLKIRKLRPL